VKAGWKLVKLGEVLSKTAETVEANATTEYSEVTVKLWGKGVVERRRVLGSEISGRRFVARSGNFIVSRIDARNGAMGLIPASLDGGLVTNDFPLFEANTERLELAYLGWLCRTKGFVDLCVGASEGSTNRVRLKEDRFLSLEIPLPPLAEQRQIVARVEALAGEIEEARTLKKEVVDALGFLVPTAISSVLGTDWPIVALEDACDAERPITYGIVQAGEHVQDGIPYIRVSDMSKPVLTTVGMLRTSKQIADRYRRSAVAAGDLVFAIRATVGKMRFVPQELDGANLTQGTARIAPSNRASSAYLCWALQSRNVVDAIAAATKGSTFKEITLGRLRTIPLPLPPIAEQRRIVAELDALQAEVDALKRLQSETAAELDALLPAILDRAFKGEL
jgi:type I restriction enzyme S subunit